MFCKHCGNKVNDTAAFCNKCGNNLKEVLPTSQATKQPEVHTTEKAPSVTVIVSIMVAVVAVIALILVLCFKGSDSSTSQNGIKPNTISANEEKPEKVKLKLNVELCDNSFFARYGIDIVVNDTVIKTLLQGESYSTTIDVEKGNYTIKFVKNYSTSEEISNNKNVKSASATEEIVRDTSMNFTIQTHEKYIEITDYSVK